MVRHMNNLNKNRRGRLPVFAFLCRLALLLAAAAALLAPATAWCATAGDVLKGERIYREGILPSGEHLRASVKGEPALPGLTFTCASCHLRSGLGAFDEGVHYPPISAGKLFQPVPSLYKGTAMTESAALPPLRPAYTNASLVEALRVGKNPDGRVLSDLMPRYKLSDEEAGYLVAYLKTLSAELAPGVSADAIRFATVVSEDLPAAQRDALFSSLDAFVKMKNNQILSFGNRFSGTRARRMAESMQLSHDSVGMSLSLAHWTLKGAPATWRAQLEEYQRKEPVFALLGGMVSGPWQPIHQFCEDNRVPALFPNTDLPVISDTSWYTLYQSKGYHQEGAAAAAFLNGREGVPEGAAVLQLVRTSPEAQALSAGFQQTWRELGRQPPVTLQIPRGTTLDGDFLKEVLTREKPAILLVWDTESALPGLETLKGRAGRPDTVMLSARYLGESSWRLPESIRDFSYLTYPYVFSTKVVPVGMIKLAIKDDVQQTLKQAALPGQGAAWEIVVKNNAATRLLSSLLMDLRGNYYRDNLLDVAGMMPDQLHQLFGRSSFGSDQRYASKGCFIVQLSHGAIPELVKKSGWIIH